MDIYLRPLRLEDASISYHWRNDLSLWRYTGKRPNCEVTEQMEREWITRVMSDDSRRNYAICLKSNDCYIGNIYLVNIVDGVGELGVFIGEKRCQGKGYAQQALALLKEQARLEGVTAIRIAVNNQNIPALITYLKQGAYFDAPAWMQLNLPLKGV